MNVLERIILDKQNELYSEMRRHPLEVLKQRVKDEPLPEHFNFAAALKGKKPAALIARSRKPAPARA